MARARNSTCPECGCEEIRKEKMLGLPTGDLICSHCGYTSTRQIFEETYRHTHPENED